MTETQYALAWYMLRMKELRRVPWPDHNWLRGKIGNQHRQRGLFDNHA